MTAAGEQRDDGLSDEARRFLARFDGIEAPDWSEPHELSAMGVRPAVARQDQGAEDGERRCTCPETDPLERAATYTVARLGIEPHSVACPQWGTPAQPSQVARDAVLAGLNQALRTEGADTVLRDRLEALAGWLDDAADTNDETVQSLRPSESRARHTGLRDAYRDAAHMVRAALRPGGERT